MTRTGKPASVRLSAGMRETYTGREPNWPFLGYAPGWYMGKCGSCGEDMIAAKRAMRCLACAIDAAKAGLAKLPPRFLTEDEQAEIDAIVGKVTDGFRADIKRILGDAS